MLIAAKVVLEAPVLLGASGVVDDSWVGMFKIHGNRLQELMEVVNTSEKHLKGDSDEALLG